MSDIAFINNSDHNEEGYVINPLISFTSWEEYMRLKDMNKRGFIRADEGTQERTT